MHRYDKSVRKKDTAWPGWPESMPEPHGPLKVAIVALRGLGERPERRRQACFWDSCKKDLLEVLEAKMPEYGEEMRNRGWCPQCFRHIGKGVRMHGRHCKSEMMEAMLGAIANDRLHHDGQPHRR